MKKDLRMNWIKKIALGALIMVAGVMMMPGKVWAAPSKIESLTYSLSGDNLTFTVTLDDKATSDVSIKLAGTSLANQTIYAETNNCTFSDTISNLFGSNTSCKFTAEDVAFVLTESSDLVLYLPQVSLSENKGSITVTPKAGKNDETFSATYTPSDTGYYVASSSPGGTVSGNTISGLSFGTTYTVTLSNDRTVTLDTSIPSPISSNYSSKLTVTPSLPYIAVDITDKTERSGTSGTYSCNAAYAEGTVTINSSVSGDMIVDAKLSVYASENPFASTGPYEAKYKIKDFSFTIAQTAPTVNSITISGPSEVYTGTTTKYTATIDPSTAASTPVTWTITNKPTGSTASIDNSGNFNAGSVTGAYKIQASAGGKNSNVLDIEVKNETIASVTIAGPTSMIAAQGKTWKYTSADVWLDTAKTKKASNQSVTWAITDGSPYGSIDSSTGVLTLGAGATKGNVIKVQATSAADETTKSNVIEITLTDIIEVSSISYETTTVTKGYKLDMSPGKNLKINPTNAEESIDHIVWATSDSNVGEINGDIKYKNYNSAFKGNNTGKTTLTPTIYYVNGTNKTLSGTQFEVVNPVISNGWNGDAYTFTLPDKVYTSYSDSNNISEVTGYRVDLLNESGNSIYNSTTSTSSKNITLSSETVENMIENASGNLSGNTHNIRLKISPVGKSQTSSGNTVTNPDAMATSDQKTAYRVSVSGSNIASTAIYGLPNHSVKITATPINSSYKFANWSDGTTTNPRNVTVSTTTANNSYVATANTTGTPTANGAGAAGGKTNSNLDKVPKTGEDDFAVWAIVIAMITGSLVVAILVDTFRPKKNG